MNKLIGKYVTTIDGHSGIVVKHFKPTGMDMTVHIKQADGKIWYCPESCIIEIKDKENQLMNKEEIERLLNICNNCKLKECIRL